jgi:CBS domain-containing protein
MSMKESTATGQVREVMTPDVLGIVPSALLGVALRMMVEADVHHLPVVDGGRCVGLLHEADVLWRLWSTDDRRPPVVAAVVRRPPLVIAAEDTVRVAASRMIDAATDAALVMEDGRVVGIVTATDILRLVATG